jgi:hypothetical protein
MQVDTEEATQAFGTLRFLRHNYGHGSLRSPYSRANGEWGMANEE